MEFGKFLITSGLSLDKKFEPRICCITLIIHRVIPLKLKFIYIYVTYTIHAVGERQLWK